MIAVGGAVLSLLAVALVVRHGRAGSLRPTAVPSPRPDSMPAQPSSATARPPAATGSTKGAAATSTNQAPAPAMAASPGGSVIRRYAQTWVNVRGDRTRSAPTVGMLNPGDAVTVDSLVRGWYRVMVDGRTLGYVHRSTLDVRRPE
jgi:hypothetical protein